MRSVTRVAMPWMLVVLSSCGDDDVVARPDAALPDAAPPDAAAPDAAPLNACDPTFLPMNRAIPLACCFHDGEEWFISGNQTSLGNLVHRRHGSPCTRADGSAGCVGMQCDHGPCGGLQIEIFMPPSHVFHPLSDPTACGREATGLPGVPEAWTEARESYSTVVPSCPYTECQATGPTARLTVATMIKEATGHVTSAPAGIDLTGAATGSAPFAQLDVTLTAEPLGPHARAVFTGDCAATGEVGKPASCKVKLGPDKAVNVTFECEGGATCPAAKR